MEDWETARRELEEINKQMDLLRDRLRVAYDKCDFLWRVATKEEKMRILRYEQSKYPISNSTPRL